MTATPTPANLAMISFTDKAENRIALLRRAICWTDVLVTRIVADTPTLTGTTLGFW
jgi:hypothetical protein